MPKRFTFVSGDIGGTRMMVPVANLLKEQGHKVAIYADGSGKGIDVWNQEKFNFNVLNDFDSIRTEDIVEWSDLIFISTCASASALSEEMARRCYGFVPVVMGADGFYNHGFKKWQLAQADYWFAITESHAEAIRSLRPDFPKENVRVVGQPAFDNLVDLVSKKEEIRKLRRVELGISDDEITALWWSQGMGELIEEDIEMTKEAIRSLSTFSKKVFIMRLHPKLELIKKGYLEDIGRRITNSCAVNGVRLISSAGKIPGEELNLAADMIWSITATDDIKNIIIGGPPVVHIWGPVTQKWFESELFLTRPYLIEVKSGQALAAFSKKDIPFVINDALNLETRKRLLANWQPPREKATEKIAKELIALAK